MKKILTFALSCIITLNTLTLNIVASGKKSTNDLAREAHNVLVLDGDSNQVIFEKNGYKCTPMASTTKILTALITLNTTKMDEEIKISKNAHSVRGSKVGYSASETLKSLELLYGLMFKSGNDAAIALSEGIALNETNFANLMNQFAHQFGLLDSNFETPHGLDSKDHYTTCYDLAMLTSKAMKNETFKKIVSSKEIKKSTNNFTRDYNNINKILWQIPEANGVKTGYTGQAGKCLVTSVNHAGRNLIIVVFNCNERWAVTERLYKYAIENYDFHSVKYSDIDSKLKNNSTDVLNFCIKKDHKYDIKLNSYKRFKNSNSQNVIRVRDLDTNEEILKKYI